MKFLSALSDINGIEARGQTCHTPAHALNFFL